jgi:hypothetical protein
MTDSSQRSSSTVFRVGAVVGGAIQGPGRLTIEPGRLILKPSWPLRRLSGVVQVVHTESPRISRQSQPWPLGHSVARNASGRWGEAAASA